MRAGAATLQNETRASAGPGGEGDRAAKPGLQLDYAGQPSVGVGADPFGTYATGGMSFLFSDMLGNHTVGTGVQVTSRFDEFGGSLFYINRSRRWNWGVGIDQTPHTSIVPTTPASPAMSTSSRSCVFSRSIGRSAA